MKLHLPKSLLLSLLSALTLAAPLAVTLGSSAWAGSWNEGVNEEYNFTGTDDATELNTEGHVGVNGTFVKAKAPNLNITLTKITQVDGQKLTITGTWRNSTNSFNVLTVEELSMGDGSGSGALTIADDFGETLTTQRIKIEKISGAVTNLIVDTYGVLQLGAEGGANTFTIKDGTIESGGELHLIGGTYNITGLSNSGTVVMNEGSADVVLNNLVDKTSGKYDPSVITNTSTGNLVVENTGNKTLSGTITIANGGTVTLRGGTFGTSSAGLSNTIKTEAGTFLGFEDISVNIGGNANSKQMLDADIIVGNGATLTMTFEDRYHYNNKHTLKVLSGGSVVLGNTRQTLARGFIVELAGGTITGVGDSKGMALDFYNGGTIKVTENSTLDANTGGHNNNATITLDVANGKTLTMNGNFVMTAITVSNEGIVVYKGEVFAKDLDIDNEKGVFEYNFTGERTHTGSITGTGTLRKSGAGTLTLSSANTTVTNLAVTGGKLVYTVADEKTHTLSGTGGTFEKTGAGTLNLGALTSYDFAGGLTVSEGKVVFSGSSDEQVINPPAFVKLVNGLTTVGEAQVEIQGDVVFNHQGSAAGDCVITLDDNIYITGNLEINSTNSVVDEDGDSLRRWNVNEGGDLSVGGHLWLTNKQKMVVDGGVVSAAGGVQLGHSSNGTGQWTNHSIYSKLIIEDGGVTTSGLTFHGGNNELLMSGGELTFTPTATEDNPAPDVLSGGGTETYKNKFTVTGGTLKATDKSWALTGTSTHVVSLGNATFDIAADKTITLSGTMALTGSLDVVGDGTLQVGGTTWNVQSSDLANFMVTGGVVNDSTKVNGLGTYSDYIFIRGNVEQQPDTATSILVDNAATTIHKQDGYWTFTGTAAGAYVIGGNFSTEEAATDTDAVGADVFVVNKEGVFTIAGDIADGKTAKELVMTTLGTGKIKLDANVDLSHSGEDIHFAGSLDIESGATLTLGRVFDTGIDSTSSNTTEYDINISSLSSLNLNGGTLKMYYVAPHIKSMTVAQASTISIDDVWSAKQTAKADATRIDSLQLDANLSMETNWKSNVNIGVLSGDSNLTVTQTNSSESKASHLWIDGVDNYTGTISLSGRMALILNIGDKQSLNTSQISVSGSNARATLTGSGLYNLGVSTSLGSGVSLSNDTWTGTVRIQGDGNSQNNLDLNNLSNENSAVELINVNGWFSATMAGALVLTKDTAGNAAWTINYGSSGQDDSKYDIFTMATFEGSVSGDGTMKYAWDGGSGYTGFTFSGDVSEWTGEFVQTVGNNEQFNLVLNGKADTVNAEIKRSEEEARLHLRVDTDAAATFNKTIDVTKLTLAQSVGFSSGTENTVAGALTIEADAGKSISLTNDTTLSVTGGLTSDYGLSITGGAGGVTLSGATNSISGGLSIASDNSLTLAKGSALTVNSPIQNNGNLDIQGTVNWNLASTEGLTVTYSEAELSRKENRLDAGVIRGLITGSGTLTISDNASATVNGKNGTFTNTGLVTVDDVVYYVMKCQSSDEGGQYAVNANQFISVNNVVNVGNNTFESGPVATDGVNSALGFYLGENGLGENGVLCISGDSDKLTASDILVNTQGTGSIILRSAGVKNEVDETTGVKASTLYVDCSSATSVTGALYITPQILLNKAGNPVDCGHVEVSLNAGADISYFSSIMLGNETHIRVKGEIGRANENIGHFNNVGAYGNSQAYIIVENAISEEIVLGGITSLSSCDFGTGTLPSGAKLYLRYAADGQIRINALTDGAYGEKFNDTMLVLQTDNAVNGKVYIDSFKYSGEVFFYGHKGGTLHAEINLRDDEILNDIQCVNSAWAVDCTETLLIKGAGRYVLSKGSSIDVNRKNDSLRTYNFGVLDSNWTGTVEVNNLDAIDAIDAIKGIKIADYGNANSTIHFKGFKGYLTDDATEVEIKPALILENTYNEDGSLNMSGYEITDGGEEQAQTYTGVISGTGDFVVSAGSNMKFNLQGNISKWAADDTETPEFIVQNGTQALNFSGSATEVNAIIKVAPSEGSSNAALKVSVGDANTAHTTTFNESVVASSLTTYTNTTAQFKGNTTRIGNVNLGAVEDAEAAVIEDGMKIFNGNTVQGGEARNTVMSFEGEGYVSDAKLTNVVLTSTGSITELQEKVSINLKNLHDVEDVYLSGAVNFVSGDTQDNFKFVETIEAFGQTYNEVRFESSSFSGMTLAIAELGYLGNITLTVADGITVADSTEVWKGTDAPTNVSILLKDFTVEGLTIGKRMEGMFDPLQFNVDSAQVVALSEDTAMSVSQLLNYKSYREVYFVQQEDGLFIRMSNIPEPTTATLSLLALAALASRRRRK